MTNKGETSSAGARATSPAPSEYPAEWNIPYRPSQPPAPGYDLTRKTEIYKAGSTQPPYRRALGCDVRHERDIPVKLRDGTTIYVDLLMPAQAKGPLPAIMAWSPYGKTLPGRVPVLPAWGFPSVPLEWHSGYQTWEGPDAAFWCAEGYVIVHPDVRGAWRSEGKIHFWGCIEAADGHDVIEWVAEQPWSNGSVGLAGNSWLAVAQWCIAATHPPHLKAIAPWSGFCDVARNVVLWGGIPNLGFLGMVAHMLSGSNQTEDFTPVIERSPLINDYWKDKRAAVEQIEIPAYVTADLLTMLHTEGTFDGFRRLGSKNKWLRVNKTNEWFDQYTPENERDLLKFFDRYLKGIENGWEATPRVRVSIVDMRLTRGDAGTFNTPFDDFPVPGTHYHKLYLNAAEKSLSPNAPAGDSAASYDGKTGKIALTIRFDEDVQLIGYPMARLWVEAKDADDMDLFLLVDKLAPDGSHLEMSPTEMIIGPKHPTGVPGRLRISMRELDAEKSTPFAPVYTIENPQKLKPGEIVPVDIAILPIAARWTKGEQLRLTIAGRFDPDFPPVPTINTGTHVIHTGGAHASYLQVPVVRAK